MDNREQTLMRLIGSKLERGITVASVYLVRVAMVILLCQALLVTYDVVARYVFNRPLMGSAEITQLLLVGIIFLGLGYATLTNSHIRMSFVIDKLAPSRRRGLNLVTDLVSIIILIFFTRQVYIMALKSLERGQSIPHAPFLFPQFWPQLAIAIGLTVFCLQLVATTYRNFRGTQE